VKSPFCYSTTQLEIYEEGVFIDFETRRSIKLRLLLPLHLSPVRGQETRWAITVPNAVGDGIFLNHY
jgi:hypothetical protein